MKSFLDKIYEIENNIVESKHNSKIDKSMAEK